MRRAMVLWALALAVTARAADQKASSADKKAPFQKAVGLTDALKEDFLTNGTVVRTRSVGTGVTGSVRATLRKDGLEHDAHIQSIDQGKPVKELGAGTTEMDFRDTYRGNVAAYRLDRLLGLGMIPVTVERDFERKKAAFTWWVDDVLMDELQRHEKKIEAPDPPAWNRQIWVVRIFDQLIYNFDRNLGNLLVDKSWNLWMIDHTRAFKIFKELKDQANLGTHCPRALLLALRKLDRENVRGALGRLLTQAQIDGLLGRRDLIVKYFDDRIAEIGEKQVLYDLPPRLTAAPASR
jgi:hypothetical protein